MKIDFSIVAVWAAVAVCSFNMSGAATSFIVIGAVLATMAIA